MKTTIRMTETTRHLLLLLEGSSKEGRDDDAYCSCCCCCCGIFVLGGPNEKKHGDGSHQWLVVVPAMPPPPRCRQPRMQQTRGSGASKRRKWGASLCRCQRMMRELFATQTEMYVSRESCCSCCSGSRRVEFTTKTRPATTCRMCKILEDARSWKIWTFRELII